MRKKVGGKQHLFKKRGDGVGENYENQVQVDNLPGLPTAQHKNQTFSEAKIKYSLEGTPFALVFLNLEVFHSNICNYRQL